MVVDDENGADAYIAEPRRDRACTRGVVRHEPDERGAAETDICRHRGDLEEPSVSENRRGLEHLRGVEVAYVGERRVVAGCLARVGDG